MLEYFDNTDLFTNINPAHCDIEKRQIPFTKPGTKLIDVYHYKTRDGIEHTRFLACDTKDLFHTSINDATFSTKALGEKHDYHYIAGKLAVPFDKLGKLVAFIASGKSKYSEYVVEKIRAITTFKQPQNPTLFDIEPVAKPQDNTTNVNVEEPSKPYIYCDANHHEIINYWADKGVLIEIYTTELTHKFINNENPKPIDNRRELAQRGF